MTLRIHELPADPGARQKRKRVGRGKGSGHGETAGRGIKGHQSRQGGSKGGSFEGGQMPLTRRLPKFGFRNTRFRTPRSEVTLRELNRFADGTVVDIELIKKEGLVPKKVRTVKLICKGELERKLTIKLNGLSAGARAAVEARGGTWEIIPS